MRKGFILVLLLVFALSQLAAMEMGSKGIKGGLNIASWSGDYVEDFDSKLGLIIGGFISYPVNDQFSFQPEVYYTMKGVSYDYSESYMGYSYSDTGTASMNYLEIPLLGVFNLSQEASFQPKLFAGPFIGFNLSATYESDWEETDGGETYSGNDSGDLEDMNSLEYGLIFGGAIEIDKIVIEFRYNMGLSNIYSDSDDFSRTNTVISIMLGYKL